MIFLDKITKTNIFRVPENYFEGLNSTILNQIIEPSKDINSVKELPFLIPKDYFEELSTKITDKIKESKSSKINIESLERVNIFKVLQEGYFENISEEINSKIHLKEGKTIEVDWWKKIQVKWLLAASIILIAGLWFGISQFTKNEPDLAIEKISNDDIKIYLETQDLSYFEYESSTKTVQNSIKMTGKQVLDDFNINKQDILEHLRSQDLEDI